MIETAGCQDGRVWVGLQTVDLNRRKIFIQAFATWEKVVCISPTPPPPYPHTPTQTHTRALPTFKRLTEDENVEIRRSIALGFHEVRRKKGKGRGGGREMRWRKRGRK